MHKVNILYCRDNVVVVPVFLDLAFVFYVLAFHDLAVFLDLAFVFYVLASHDLAVFLDLAFVFHVLAIHDLAFAYCVPPIFRVPRFLVPRFSIPNFASCSSTVSGLSRV